MIRIEEVTKTFGKLKALNNFSANCSKGECIALIGPNGSGKTTLIKCILGMVCPDKGRIFFKEKNIIGDYSYRSDIGYMPQIGRYPENMTVGQVFDMMRDIRKHHSIHSDNELYVQFEIGKILNKRMRNLSGGTRQKVSASLAFMFGAEVIILDEPTAGLDPVASEVLKTKIVKEKEAGKLIFLTSHILSDLDDLVTQIIYMQDGKLKFHKEIEALKLETGEVKLSRAIANVMMQNLKDE
jgi:Cu-processing system ATP-binding protein